MSIYAFMHLITLIFVLLISLFVFFKNPYSRTNQSYSLYGLSLFVWSFGVFLNYLYNDKQIALYMSRIALSGAFFIPLTAYHFSAEFVNSKFDKKIIPYMYLSVLPLIYLCNYTDSFVSDVYKYYWGYYPKATIWAALIGILYYLFSARLIYILFKRLSTTKETDALQYDRIKYVLAAMIVSTVAGLDYIAMFGIPFYPPAHILTLIMLSIIAYAILRHQLMDIKVIIKRTIVFAAIFAIVYAIVTFFTLFLQLGFEKLFEVHRLAVSTSSYTGSWPSVVLFGSKINIFSIPPFLISMLTLFLGLFVYLKNRKSNLNRIFSVECVAAFGWLFSFSIMYSCKNADVANLWAKLGEASLVLIPVIFYHFTIALLGIKNKKTLIKDYMLPADYLRYYVFSPIYTFLE